MTKRQTKVQSPIKLKVNLITSDSVSFGLFKKAGCTGFKRDCNLVNADLISFSYNPIYSKTQLYMVTPGKSNLIQYISNLNYALSLYYMYNFKIRGMKLTSLFVIITFPFHF